jgi:hypothetical protein
MCTESAEDPISVQRDTAGTWPCWSEADTSLSLPVSTCIGTLRPLIACFISHCVRTDDGERFDYCLEVVCS